MMVKITTNTERGKINIAMANPTATPRVSTPLVSVGSEHGAAVWDAKGCWCKIAWIYTIITKQ